MNRLKNKYSSCMECGGKMKMKKGGKWIQKAIKKPGSFTEQAKREGMSVSGFKNKVLSNKENYSPTTVKRANLANTLSKMRKGQKGMQTKDPAVNKFLYPMADSLMNESNIKKNWANKQEEIAKYQIKTVGSNVPYVGTNAPYMINGVDPYAKSPTANQRMKNVKQLRKSASMDSARAVNIKPSLIPKKKMQNGGSIPGVNGTMIANTSNVSQPTKLPKKGAVSARRNAGTSGKSKFKSVLARKKMK